MLMEDAHEYRYGGPSFGWIGTIGTFGDTKCNYSHGAEEGSHKGLDGVLESVLPAYNRRARPTEEHRQGFKKTAVFRK